MIVSIIDAIHASELAALDYGGPKPYPHPRQYVASSLVWEPTVRK